MTVRQPAVAGSFYSADPERLTASMERAFEHRLGPQRLPVLAADGPRELKGLICPHAGFQYSGAAAAWAYDALASDGAPERIVVLGTSHRWPGRTPALSSCDSWETPLGNVNIDAGLNAELLEAGLPADDSAHESEHSIEVQLPWLQYVLRDEFSICPITIASLTAEDLSALAQALARALAPRRGIVIASSDCSHYLPAGAARQLDSLALEQVKRLSADGLIQVVKERGISMCGALPVACAIETARLLGATEAEVLSYYTSGDVSGDISSVVGYAAVAIR